MLKDFIWQCLDLLNSEFAVLNKEMRPKKLPIVTKHIVQPDDKYESIKETLLCSARMNNCRQAELELAGVEIPAKIN